MLEPGWSENGHILVIPPSPASYQELVSFHDREYIDYILDAKNYSEDSDKAARAEFGLEEVYRTIPFAVAHDVSRTAQRSRGFLPTYA